MCVFDLCFGWTKTAAIVLAMLASTATAQAGPGRLDYSLGLNFVNGAQINAIEVQPDGKVIVAGAFQIANETRRDIIRLNANNTIDTTFHAGTALAGSCCAILAIKIQPDGKILVGGNFSGFNNAFSEKLIRLNSDGTVDQTFSLTGLNVNFVFDIDLQSSGKVLISMMNAIGTTFVARFGTTGAHDPTFTFPFFGGSGFTIDVGSGDKVIIGGSFTYTINQNQYRNLARMGVDGGIDTTFTAEVAASGFPSVEPMELDGGRILVWGRFDFVNNLARRGLAIVNSDGSTNTQFDPSAIQVETIRAAEYQADGKVVIAGENFTRTNTRIRGNIARFNSDGSIDTTFFQGRGASGPVRVIRLRGSNRLLLGGDFVRYDRAARKYLAQILV